MRKVRDYDAELKALENRAKAIKARRIKQLGQLVQICCCGCLYMHGAHTPKRWGCSIGRHAKASRARNTRNKLCTVF